MSNLLNYIDSINSNVNDAEINVLQSQLDVYSKASMLLEYYEGDDLSAFEVFQEQTIREDMKEQAKGMGIIKKFLTLIPRLIRAILNKIKNTKSKDIEIKEKVEGYDVNKKINDVMKSADKNKIEKSIKIAATAGVLAGLSAITVHKKKNNKNKSQTSSNTNQTQSEKLVKDEQKSSQDKPKEAKTVEDETTTKKPKAVNNEQNISQPEKIKNNKNETQTSSNTDQPQSKQQETVKNEPTTEPPETNTKNNTEQQEVENKQPDEDILKSHEITISIFNIINKIMDEGKKTIETYTKKNICEDIITSRYKYNKNIINRIKNKLKIEIPLVFTEDEAMEKWREINSYGIATSDDFWRFFNDPNKDITYPYSPFFLFDYSVFRFINYDNYINYDRYKNATLEDFKTELNTKLEKSKEASEGSRKAYTFGIINDNLIKRTIENIQNKIEYIENKYDSNKVQLPDSKKEIIEAYLFCLNVFVDEAKSYILEVISLNDKITKELNSIYNDKIINKIKNEINDFYLKNEKSFSVNNIDQDALDTMMKNDIENHIETRLVGGYIKKINNKKENN